MDIGGLSVALLLLVAQEAIADCGRPSSGAILGIEAATTDHTQTSATSTLRVIRQSSATDAGENAAFVSLMVQPTGSMSSYEKEGIYSRIATLDGSPTNDLDAVAGEFQAVVEGSQKNGRIWGLNASASVRSGADAYAVAAELGVTNNGMYQAKYGSPNAKIALHAVCGGSQDCTAALVTTGIRSWEYGVLVQQSALRADGYAWVLLDKAGNPIAGTGQDGRTIAAGASFSAPIKLASYTVAELNAAIPCRPDKAGSLAFVSDAMPPAYASLLRGGSQYKVLALCDGMNWTAH